MTKIRHFIFVRATFVGHLIRVDSPIWPLFLTNYNCPYGRFVCIAQINTFLIFGRLLLLEYCFLFVFFKVFSDGVYVFIAKMNAYLIFGRLLSTILIISLYQNHPLRRRQPSYNTRVRLFKNHVNTLDQQRPEL